MPEEAAENVIELVAEEVSDTPPQGEALSQAVNELFAQIFEGREATERAVIAKEIIAAVLHHAQFDLRAVTRAEELSSKSGESMLQVRAHIELTPKP